MVSDFEHCQNLGKHAVCNSLNGFTHLEYYRHADVRDFIKKVLEIVPDQVIRINEDLVSTTHREIKKYAGSKLTSQSD